MHRSRWKMFVDRVRSHPWWPIHYRADNATWWVWRNRYWRFKER